MIECIYTSCEELLVNWYVGNGALAIKYIYPIICIGAKQMTVYFNPLKTEFFYNSVLQIQPKLDSYRLPTRRHGTHNFFFFFFFILS